MFIFNKRVIYLAVATSSIISSLPGISYATDSTLQDDRATEPQYGMQDSAGTSKTKAFSQRLNAQITKEIGHILNMNDTDSMTGALADMELTASVLAKSIRNLKVEIVRAEENIGKNPNRNALYELSPLVGSVSAIVAVASLGTYAITPRTSMTEILAEFIDDKDALEAGRISRRRFILKSKFLGLGSTAVAAASVLIRQNILTVTMKLDRDQFETLKDLVATEEQALSSVNFAKSAIRETIEIRKAGALAPLE
jgi:hypothetical protein